MTKQFYQLHMKMSSLKYLGIMTPFKLIMIYTRAAMGMPGSTVHLDELMLHILWDIFRGGVPMKLSDNLYVGGNTVPELLKNWTNNLRLSPSKTVICSVTTTVLGWTWWAGSFQVSPH